MDAVDWDQRYSERELVWSAGPNVFVAEVAGELPPGRALDVACGEGRNALWLAGRGWSVTAVDFSSVALAKARRWAKRTGGKVEWVHADVLDWQPAPDSFDLVVAAYLQLSGEAMARVLARATRALALGGRLLVVGHARLNRTKGVGGPTDPAVLYEPEDVVAWLAGLEVVRAEHVTRDVGTPDGLRQAIDTLVLAQRRAAP